MIKIKENKMKKIIIAAFVAVFSMAVNAALANWTVTYSYKPGTTSYNEGWSVYFFDANQVSRAQMITAIEGNSYQTYIDSYGGLAEDLTDSEGYALGTSKKTTYGNPETITGYFVLFNSDISTVDPTLAYVSATMDQATGGTTGQTADFVWGDMTQTQTLSNWTAVAPEPTSGLLLLIGMAGIALKRKRA